MPGAITIAGYSPKPGDRVHHKCWNPDCPLFGTVLSADPKLTMLAQDGKVFKGWARIAWDGYVGTETTLPKGYEQELPFERLEIAGDNHVSHASA